MYKFNLSKNLEGVIFRQMKCTESPYFFLKEYAKSKLGYQPTDYLNDIVTRYSKVFSYLNFIRYLRNFLSIYCGCLNSFITKSGKSDSFVFFRKVFP